MTLHDNVYFGEEDAAGVGLATILLASIVLTNPFTEKLFYFDVSAGYVEGPWYRLMYYSALFHLAVILILVISWRKEFGPSENKGDPGYPDPVRMRGSDPAFALPSADDRFWHESWNTGSVSYYQ